MQITSQRAVCAQWTGMRCSDCRHVREVSHPSSDSWLSTSCGPEASFCVATRADSEHLITPTEILLGKKIVHELGAHIGDMRHDAVTMKQSGNKESVRGALLNFAHAPLEAHGRRAPG